MTGSEGGGETRDILLGVFQARGVHRSWPKPEEFGGTGPGF